ncbi:MAG: prepilin-type N-terminal cleavage/methylation domain-containing protein [Sedimentisphaerales bacterium]|nr:prepilin-type N-terminal cleavage/methylation domain-containing protein [Sedimentisphaerales bacterium]
MGTLKNTKQRFGVTLIELLIVVLILAALAAIAVPRISQSAYQAKLKACETNIKMFNSMLEQYYSDNGKYPSDMDVLFKDTNYFPDGKPICPITEKEYKKDLTSDKRYDASKHNSEH